MKCRPYVSTESEKQELSDAYSIRCVECYKQIDFRFPELLIDAEDKVAVPLVQNVPPALCRRGNGASRALH